MSHHQTNSFTRTSNCSDTTDFPSPQSDECEDQVNTKEDARQLRNQKGKKNGEGAKSEIKRHVIKKRNYVCSTFTSNIQIGNSLPKNNVHLGRFVGFVQMLLISERRAIARDDVTN